MTAVSYRQPSGHGEPPVDVAALVGCALRLGRLTGECVRREVRDGGNLRVGDFRGAQVHPIESFVRSSWRRQVVGFLTGAALPGGQR